MLHHQRRQVSIFAEGKQILLVKGVDINLGVLINDSGGDDDGTALVGGSNPVDTETSRQTGNGSEKTFECLGQVV